MKNTALVFAGIIPQLVPCKFNNTAIDTSYRVDLISIYLSITMPSRNVSLLQVSDTYFWPGYLRLFFFLIYTLKKLLFPSSIGHWYYELIDQLLQPLSQIFHGKNFPFFIII